MHDLSHFREHLDLFAEMAKKRGAALDLDAYRALDKERRTLITATEQLKAQRNQASEEIARLKKEKQNADSLIAEMKAVAERIKSADERIAQLDTTQRELLLTIPNVPHASVPVGHSAADNVEVRRWGAPPKFDFTPKPHWEVGERAGILDLPAATKITGARFAVYKGWGARHRFLVDADRGSRAAQPASRRNTPRGKAANLRHRLDRVLSLRSWRGWKRHARDFKTASISESGALQVHAPRKKLRRTRIPDAKCRSYSPKTRPALPRHAALHRRHGLRLG
jgi:hypothetical protein